MSRLREEDELTGRRSGEVFLEDDGAFTEIEDFDPGDPLDAEQNPYLPSVVDEDTPEDTEAARDYEGSPKEDGFDGLDDFDTRVSQEQTAHEASGGDQLAAGAHVVAQQGAALSKEAPWSRVTPPSSYRAVLGGRATITRGQEPQHVVLWRGDDVESMPVSVMFRPLTPIPLPLPGAGGPFFLVRPFLRVQFGTRDAMAEVDIDIGSGGQITVPGSIVNVLLGMDFPLSGEGPEQFSLASSVGYFPIVRTSRITRTSSIYELLLADTAAVPRPAFATDVLVYHSNLTNSLTLQFITSAGVTLYTQTIGPDLAGAPTTSPSYITTPIQLANEIAGIWVTNNGPQNDIVGVIWGLHL